MKLLLLGCIFGFTISIPPGPVAFEVIKRGLARGFWVAFPVGIGASFADLTYAGLIFFGAINLITEHTRVQSAIYLLGAVLLLLLGTISIHKIIKGNQTLASLAERDDPTTKKTRSGIDNSTIRGKIFHFIRRIVLGFTIGFLNPTLFLLFITILPPIFANILSSNGRETAFLFVIGLVFGVILWFLLEAAFASLFKKLLTEKVFKIISLVLNSLLIVSAGYFIYKFIEMVY